jgi:tRNA dimethylallyltransferase
LENSNHLIVIQGPTASGKTALAIALAKKWNCAVLSADSRQFYQEISIGTAKPSPEEQDGIHHFFIDSHSIDEPVSAAQFEREALEVLDSEFKKRNIAILVGGSGLFIDALCNGLDPLPSDIEMQKKWQDIYEHEGLTKIQDELKILDLDYANNIDLLNPHRVLRALEILSLTGKKMAEVRKNQIANRPFEIIKFVVTLPREILYKRIDERVVKMIEEGLLEEAKTVLPFHQLQSLNTVGYKELFAHLRGETDLKSAISLIQQNSRRYAKRQLTWFRRNKENIWLLSQTTEDRKAEIVESLQKSVSK